MRWACGDMASDGVLRPFPIVGAHASEGARAAPDPRATVDYSLIRFYMHVLIAYWEKRERGVVFSRPLRALRAA